MSAPYRADVTVLDCTLRDGGYYTNWEFAPELALACVEACDLIGVDIVELGYVRFAEEGYGPFGRLPAGLAAELRERLRPGSRLRFAAMLDASDAFDRDPAGVGPEIRDKLATAPVPIDLIRVAVRFPRAGDTAGIVASLRAAGFGVCLNLMQIDLASPAALDECLAAVAGLPPLEAVYVADSLGSLNPDRARALAARFRAALPGPIGFHAHDNQGLALHNSLCVLDAGVTWLDATMSGMGRGAGNAKTEQLLTALSPPGTDLAPLYDFIACHMDPLQRRYRWGASVYYALAGLRNIHPTFVQHLEEEPFGPREKMSVLAFLSRVPATSFSRSLLREAFDHA